MKDAFAQGYMYKEAGISSAISKLLMKAIRKGWIKQPPPRQAIPPNASSGIGQLLNKTLTGIGNKAIKNPAIPTALAGATAGAGAIKANAPNVEEGIADLNSPSKINSPSFLKWNLDNFKSLPDVLKHDAKKLLRNATDTVSSDEVNRRVSSAADEASIAKDQIADAIRRFQTGGGSPEATQRFLESKGKTPPEGAKKEDGKASDKSVKTKTDTTMDTAKKHKPSAPIPTGARTAIQAAGALGGGALGYGGSRLVGNATNNHSKMRDMLATMGGVGAGAYAGTKAADYIDKQSSAATTIANRLSGMQKHVDRNNQLDKDISTAKKGSELAHRVARKNTIIDDPDPVSVGKTNPSWQELLQRIQEPAAPQQSGRDRLLAEHARTVGQSSDNMRQAIQKPDHRLKPTMPKATPPATANTRQPAPVVAPPAALSLPDRPVAAPAQRKQLALPNTKR